MRAIPALHVLLIHSALIIWSGVYDFVKFKVSSKSFASCLVAMDRYVLKYTSEATLFSLPKFVSLSLSTPLSLVLVRKLGWWLLNYSRSKEHLSHENLRLVWASPWRWRDSDPDRWTTGVALSQHRFEGWVMFLYLLHLVSSQTNLISVYRLLPPRICCSHPGIKQTWPIWRLSKKCSSQTLFEW